jgi:CRP/FNR family transcriptional regulator, anaerobic regulatory protein
MILRYSELIQAIQHLLVDKLDKRLLDYLQTKITISGQPLVTKSHKEIAADLGTAREVISRLLKKLEHQGFLIQHNDGIEFIRIRCDISHAMRR